MTPQEKAACVLVERMLREAAMSDVRPIKLARISGTSRVVEFTVFANDDLVEMRAATLADAIERARQVRSETP